MAGIREIACVLTGAESVQPPVRIRADRPCDCGVHTYWSPRLQVDDYSLVTFASDQYAVTARYSFTDAAGTQVAPDVFVVFSKADASTVVAPQSFGMPPASFESRS